MQCRQEGCSRKVFKTISTLRAHQWSSHPEIYAKNKKPKEVVIDARRGITIPVVKKTFNTGNHIDRQIKWLEENRDIHAEKVRQYESAITKLKTLRMDFPDIDKI